MPFISQLTRLGVVDVVWCSDAVNSKVHLRDPCRFVFLGQFHFSPTIVISVAQAIKCFVQAFLPAILQFDVDTETGAVRSQQQQKNKANMPHSILQYNPNP